HAPAHGAPCIIERTCGWVATDPLGDRGGRGRGHARSLLRRVGPRARSREARAGSWRMAHLSLRQESGHGDGGVPAGRWPRPSADSAGSIKMFLELEISAWSDRVFRTLRRRGAE